MHPRVLPALAGSALAVALVAGLASPAGADTDAGFTWLATQQEADGGFEVANFSGAFETPDAIVAIASDAQTTGTWSTSEALTAVESYDGGAGGLTPLDWIDDFAEVNLTDSAPAGQDGGEAAKLIIYVAEPLGLSTTAFDPAGDGSPVDLEALLAADSPPNAFFNSATYAAIAEALTGSGDLEDRVQQIREAQQANGAWNYAGDPTFTDADIDTTGFTVMALIAAGLPPGDATVEAGLRLLAANHRPNGAWQFFGADNVNSTATGRFGVLAAGWDSATSCWRDTNATNQAGQPYVNPATYLAGQQLTTPPADAGRYGTPGPFDNNTYATSQALQALIPRWFSGQTGTATLQPATTFTDVAACQPYTQGVAWMQDNALTDGFTDGSFKPARTMSRQAMAAQLYRLVDADFVGDGTPTFSDVGTGHPFYDEVEWMVSEGITTGQTPTTFGPTQPVNRGAAATFLYRVAGEPDVDPGAPTFPDVGPHSVFREGVSWMADHRLTSGFGNGTFRPQNALSRGALATFLFRLASTEPAWNDIDLPPSVQF